MDGDGRGMVMSMTKIQADDLNNLVQLWMEEIDDRGDR